MLRIAFAALLCTCLFVHGPIGQAQEQGSPGAEQQAEHPDQDKLLAAEKEVTGEVRQLNSELAELKKVYSAAKGDEKTILEAQIRAKRKALTNSLEQLISYTKKLEDAGGQDSTQARNLSRKLVTSLLADLEKSIEEGQQRVTEPGERRSSASPENKAALDKEIEESATAVDQGLAAHFDLKQLVKAQGVIPAPGLNSSTATSNSARRRSAVSWQPVSCCTVLCWAPWVAGSTIGTSRRRTNRGLAGSGYQRVTASGGHGRVLRKHSCCGT